MSETKTCSKCHVEKKLDDFSPDSKGAFGRHGHCKKCRAKYARKKRGSSPLVSVSQKRKIAKDRENRIKYDRDVLEILKDDPDFY